MTSRFLTYPMLNFTAASGTRFFAVPLVLSGLFCGCSQNADRPKSPANQPPTSITGSGAEPGGAAGSPVPDTGKAIEAFIANRIGDGIEKFKSENGRYPNDLDEVMEKVVKAQNIKMPDLPTGKKLEYDGENHALKVVDAVAEPKQ